jgi:hypothetical protein
MPSIKPRLSKYSAVVAETKAIAMILGNSPVEQFWFSEHKRIWPAAGERIDLIFYNDLPFGETAEGREFCRPTLQFFFNRWRWTAQEPSTATRSH